MNPLTAGTKASDGILLLYNLSSVLLGDISLIKNVSEISSTNLGLKILYCTL